MNRYFFALGLGPAFALGACGGGSRNETITTVDNILSPDMVVPGNAAGGGAATAAEAMSGQDFANAVAASDAYEVAAGRLARDKATAPGLRAFGAEMVAAHTESTAKLKAAGAKAAPIVTPDPVLGVEQRADLETLRQATGADFDSAYKAQQVAAHEKALAAMKAYAANGTVREFKTFAAGAVKVVQAHLDRIRRL